MFVPLPNGRLGGGFIHFSLAWWSLRQERNRRHALRIGSGAVRPPFAAPDVEQAGMADEKLPFRGGPLI